MNTLPKQNRLYSVQEAAEILGVAAQTLRRWEGRGLLIPQRTKGNQRRYTYKQLQEFKAQQHPTQVQPKAEAHAPAQSVIEQKSDAFQPQVIELVTAGDVASQSTAESTLGQVTQGPDFVPQGGTSSGRKEVTASEAESYTDNSQDSTSSSSSDSSDRAFQLGRVNLTMLSKKELRGVGKWAIYAGVAVVVLLLSLGFSLLNFGKFAGWHQKAGTAQGVLGTSSPLTDFTFTVNIPSKFLKDVTFEGGIEATKIATLSGGIVTNNANGDFGTGIVIASNIPRVILSSIQAGSGMTVDTTNASLPTISNAGVLSLQGAKGAISLTEGTGIKIDGLTITNNGVTSLQGATGAVTLTAGTGISINGTTISTSGVGQWSGTGNDLFYTGGNVGIGTSTPAYRLDVSGGTGIVAQFSGRVIGGDAVNSNEFATLSQLNSSQAWQRISGALSPLNISDDVLVGGSSTSSAQVALSGTTPSITLGGDVDLSRGAAGRLDLGSGNRINLVSGSLEVGGLTVISSGRNIAAADGAANSPSITFSGEGTTGIYRPGTGLLGFSTGGVEQVRIDSNGNLGIGTTTPLTKLDVVGSASVSGNLTFNATATITTTNKRDLTIGSASSGDLYLYGFVNCVELLTDANGKVVCGSTGGGGSGTGIETLQVDDVNTVTSATVLNFLGSDFDLTNPQAGKGSLSIDYANSGIVRRNFAEVIGGQYSFLSDVLIGGSASSSAKFAFLNAQGAGTPTASISGNIILDSSGSIQTTKSQNLTIGGTTTGQLILSGRNASSTGITFSGYGAGVLQANASGILSSAALNLAGGSSLITGALPIANGGTNATALGSAGTIAYSDGTGYAFSSLGNAGQVLVSNGTGAPTWADPAGVGTNYFDLLNGSIVAKNTTVDLLLGGIATSSARFAVLNLNNGTPVASVSAQNALGQGIYLSADGSLQATRNNTLTIGGNTTGNISFANPASFANSLSIGGDTITDFTGTGLQMNGTSLETTLGTSVDLTTEVTGTLPIANGGTNATALGSAGSVAYSNGTGYAFTSLGSAGQVLVSGGSGAPTWQDSSAINYWVQANGTVYPKFASVYDLLIGGESTASAKFAFINTTSGTPTASISGNIVLNSTGSLQTTNNQTLTIGGNTTGNIIISNPATFSNSLSLNGDKIADFTGTGLQMNGTSLETTLGTSVDLTTEVTGTLPIANGGTNATALGSAGSIAYSNGTSYAFTALGTAGQVLVSNGSGAPTWQDSSAINYWVTANGTLYPKVASVYDLLIGGESTASAKFAFINTVSGTPTASIAGNIVLNSTGSLQSTNNQTLTIGGNTTGNIVLSNPVTVSNSLSLNGDTITDFTGTGLQMNGTSLETTLGTSVDLTTEVTGTLPIANGGTNATALGSAGTIAYSNGTGYAFTSLGTSGYLLASGGSGTPTWIDPNTLSGTNYWVTNNGTIYPKQASVFDLLIGGESTASAKFAFINTTSGTPTASIAGNLVLNSIGSLQTTNGQTLTIGGNTTGNIVLANPATFSNSLSLGGDTITDFTGTGLQMNGTSLETTLGTSVDLTTEVTGTLPIANGGTNATALGSAGTVAYSNGTSYAFTSLGTSGYLLASGGSGAPTWVDPSTLAGTNYFDLNNGALNPKNSTLDLLIGGVSTASAKFAFINNASGIPTASIAGNLVLNSVGSLQTTNNQTLTIGGNTTGNIVLANPVTVSNSLSLNGDKITDFTGTGLQMNGTSLETTLGTSVDLTTEVTGTLPIANGGTNATSLGSAGTIAYSNGTGYAFTGLGTSGFLLASGGSGAPTWIDPNTLSGTNYWVTNNGTIYPKQASVFDLLIGGESTASAKFAFINTTSGTPTASIAGNIVLNSLGSLQTTNGQTLTIGGNTTGTIVLANPVSVSSSLTLNGDTITDFTGTGLQMNGTSLETTLGTSVDLTTEVTGTLPIANGGTNATALGSAGTIAYSNGTSYAFTALGTSGQVLISGGSGAPTWVDAATVGTNYFDLANGALYPKNSTVDFLIGGTSTASAKFAFINNASGIPTASIAGNLILNSAGVLETTNKQALTIGSSTTGNINLASSVSLLSGNNLTLAGLIAKNSVLYATETTGLVQAATTNSSGLCLLSGASGPSWSTCPSGGGGTEWTLSGNVIYPTAISDQLAVGTQTTSDVISSLYITRDLASGALGKALAVFNQTENQDILTASASGTTRFTVGYDGTITASKYGAGVATFDANGVISSTPTLPIANGGTNATALGSAGSIAYSNGTSYTFSAQGISGQVLVSGGSGAPTWTDAAGIGTNYFDLANGALNPKNSTVDLLIGGVSTGSAKFAFINVNSGTPTASIAGNLVLNSVGSLQTTNNQTLTIGGNTTGNIVLANPVTLSSSLSLNGDTITDFTGTGLQMNGTSLETTLGTSVDLTTEVTGTLPIANGGTNATALGSAGTVAYSNGTEYAFTGLGSTGQVLTSNGSGAPTWTDVSGISYWVTNNGTIYPKQASVFDLLIGGESTASAKFAFINTTSGTPTASIAGNIVLNSLGSLQTTNGQTLTIGGNTTGNIVLANPATFSNSLTLNGDTITDFTGTGLQMNGTSLETTLGTSVDLTTEVTGTLPIANGGTNATALGSAGTVAYSNGTSYAFTALGNPGQVLVSNGSGAPTWQDASGVGTNYWVQANGTIYPKQASVFDLLIGGESTTSAKFAFINTTSGTPTASISGNIVLNSAGSIQATSGQNLTLGGNTTGDIILSGRNGANNGITLQGYGAGVILSAANGQLTSGTVNLASTSYVSGTLPIANGGTNATALGSAGTIAYSNGTGYAFTSLGTSGYLLASGGSGAPTWVDPSTFGTNYFDLQNGALNPKNSTVDLLIGGVSTASAKFAFINVNSGTPTASIAGNLVLNSVGSLQTTNNQTLTIGGNTTGNIVLANPTIYNSTLTLNGDKIADFTGTGLQMNGTSLETTLGTSVDLTTEVTGTLPIANGGTNATALGSAGTIAYSNGTGYAFTTLGSAGQVLTSNGSGAPTWSDVSGISYWVTNNGTIYPKQASVYDLLIGGESTASAKFAFINNVSGTPTASIAGNIVLNSAGSLQTTKGQNLTIGGATTGDIILSGRNGANNGITLQGYSTGVILSGANGQLTAGTVNLASTSYVSGTLPIANGGTNATALGSAGSVAYSNGTSYAFTAQGASGQVLISNGSSAPTWADAGVAGINYFQRSAGAVSPLDITNDLLLGGSATSSALIRLGGTPNAQSFFNTGGNIGIGLTNPSSFMLEIAGNIGPDSDGTRDLGSAARMWNNIYVKNIIPAVSGTQGYWQRGINTGAISPTNITDDVLLGATSTTSARFAFINNAGGTPIASVSAQNALGQALSLTGDGSLQTTRNNTLTIGGNTTGNIVLSNAVTLGTSVTLNGDRITDFTGTGLQMNGTSLETTLGTSVDLTTEVTGTLPIANGGTNATALGSAGTIAYSNGTGYAFTALGSTGQVLVSNGSSAPTWVDATTLSGSYFNLANGTLYPKNSTLDLLIGGTSTASAKFAVLNINNGTPTASVSATTGTGLSLAADGSIQALRMNTLTLGGATTGNIEFKPGNATTATLELLGNGNVGIGTTTAANGLLEIASSGNPILAVNGGAAGQPQLKLLQNGTLRGSLFYDNANSLLTLNRTGNAGEGLVVNGTGNVGIGTTAPGALLDVNGNASVSGTLTLAGAQSIQTTAANTLTIGGSSTGQIVLSGRNGNSTGITFQGYGTGVIQSNSGVLSSAALNLAGGSNFISGTLPIGNGGTNATALGSAGTVAFSNGTSYAFTALGTTGQVLVSGGSGTPTWADTNTGNFGLFDLNTNAIFARNSTYDLLLGGNATSSAKFAVLNMAGGTPTASVSATTGTRSGIAIAGDGSIQSLRNNALTIGGNTTGDIILSGRNGANNGITLQGYGAGVLLSASNGQLTSGKVDLSSSTYVQNTLGVTNGGTGIASFTTGDLIYASNTNTLSARGIGTAGQVLTVSGGVPTWGGSDTAAFGLFDLNTKAIFARNSTYDLLLGGNATNSAKFAVLNMAGGTPVASVSAVSTGTGLALAGDGTIQALRNNALTIGGSTTGDIILSGRNGNGSGITLQGYGAGVLLSSANGQLTSGKVDLSSSTYVQNTLGVTNGGTGIASFTTGDLIYASNTNTLSARGIGTAGQDLSVVGGVPTWRDTNTSNYGLFDLTGNAMFARNSTYDLLLGGNATSSAQFAVLNMAGGTPTASVSATTGVRGGIALGGDSTIQSLRNNTLTIGGATTGNIVLSPRNGSGTVSISGLASGALFSNSGIISSESQLAVTRGGTGLGSFTTGDLLYASNTNVLSARSIGTAGQVLTVVGGVPNWADTNSSAFGLFDLNTNAIFARNTTYDLLLGGNATSSAKFAVLNMAGGTPIASVSATTGTRSGIAIAGDGSIQSLRNNALTIGGNTTGDIILSGRNGANNGITLQGYGAGVLLSGATGQLTSGKVDLSSSTYVQNTLGVTNGGTGLASFTTGDLIYASNTNTLSARGIGTAGQDLSVVGGVPTWRDTNTSNYGLFDLNTNALFARNSTYDLLLGGSASNSAKFAVLNMAGVTPVASVSATSTGAGLALAGDGTIQALRNNTLTIGGATTGNIVLSPRNGSSGTVAISGLASGALFSSSGVISSESQLSVTRGGTGIGSFTTGDLIYASNTNVLSARSIGTAGQVLTVSGGVPTWGGSDTAAFGLFNLNANAIFARNSTYDLLLGGSATNSAQFAVLNMAGGTPAASVSATTGVRGGIALGGDSTIQSLRKNTLTIGGSTTGDISFKPGNVSTPALSVESSGNVGVGLTNAGSLLELGGGTSSQILVANGGGLAAHNSSGTIRRIIQLWTDNNVYMDSIDADFIFRTTVSATERFRIANGGDISFNQGQVYQQSSTGRLGIGTTGPNAQLEIKGTNTSDVLIGQWAGDTNWGGISMNGSLASTDYNLLSSTNSKNLLINRPSGNDIEFREANGTTAQMILKSGGNLGIGTTTPIGLLNVNGDPAGKALAILNATGSQSVLAASVSGTTKFLIDNGGNVGIGTTTPTAGSPLVVNGANVVGAPIADFQINGSTRFKLTASSMTWTGGGASNGSHTTDISLTPSSAINQTTEANIFSLGGVSFTITGGYANQRFSTIGQSTITAATSQSISTEADTLSIAGAPVSAGSATIAKSIALHIAAGSSLASGVTSGYGLYVDAPTGATNNYAATFMGGNVGIGTTTPVAALDVRGANGTSPIASLSATTAFAGMVIDNNGLGDILTASKSGAMKFTILNNGNIQTGNYKTGGGILFTDSTGQFLSTTAGSSSQCLQSTGGGTPTWGNCGTGSTDWDLVNGAITPQFASTVDLLIGGVSTASAKFSVLNIGNGGTPTASISATTGVRGGISLGGDSTIQSLRRNTLTIGGSTTGDIQFKPGNISTPALSLLSNGNVGIGTTAPTFRLDVEGGPSFFNSSGNGAAINVQSDAANSEIYSSGDNAFNFTAEGLIAFQSDSDNDGLGGDEYRFLNGASTQYVTFLGTGNVGIGTTAPVNVLQVKGIAANNAVMSVVANNATSDIFTASSSATPRFTIANDGSITATKYGAGVAQFAAGGALSSGALNLAGGSSFVTGNLPVGNGGTNTNSIGSNGTVAYSNGSAYAFTGVGTSGQVLTSAGAGQPTWTDTNTSSFGLFDLNTKAIFARNSTYDFLLGGSASSSADFAVLNMAGGTPVASVSATALTNRPGISLGGDGVIQSLNRGTLTLGGTTTGNILVNPRNGTSGGFVAPASDNVTSLGASSSARFKDLFLGPGSVHIQCTTGDGCANNMDWGIGIPTSGAAKDSFVIGPNLASFTSGTPAFTLNSKGNVGLGVTNAGVAQLELSGNIKVGGNSIIDSGNTTRIGLGSTTTLTNTTTTLSGTTTLTASSLATFTTAASLGMTSTTTVTYGSNATINGGANANDNLTLQGTSNGTRTTSYVLLQPNGGNVGIGTTAPGATLDIGSSGTIQGAGLSSDCSTSSQKLQWSSSSKQFVCGTDDQTVTIVKASTTGRTNNATPSSDPDITFTVGANETWQFDLKLAITVSSGPGIKFTMNDTATPSSCTFSWDRGDTAAADTFIEGGKNISCNTTDTWAPGSGTDNATIHIYGAIQQGASGGTFSLNWSQQSTGINTTSVLVNSWMVANKTSGADLAETYYTKDISINPGTIVSMDSSLKAGVQKSQSAYDKNVMGVVSTRPNQVFSDGTNSGMPVPVALVGRVPVKVSSINGPIQPGDPIVPSDIPGVGMKATKAGEIVGKAMEAYDNPDPTAVGMVMTYVKETWYDPDVYITDTGDVSVFEDPLDPSGTAYTVKKGTETIDRKGVFSDVVTGVIKSGIVYGDKVVVNGKNILDIINEKFASATESATTSSEGTSLSDGVKSGLDALTSRLGNVEDMAAKTASETAFLRDILAHSGLDVASDSASLQQSLENLNVNKDATIGRDLTVLGHTNLNDLGVTGSITAGVIGIDGLNGTINSVGQPLKIQSLALAPVDFMDGQVTIETNGDITTKGVLSAKKVNIDESDSASKSIGQAVISAGETYVDVTTSALTKKSHIFVTPDNPVAIGSKATGAATFRISLDTPAVRDIKVNWWIVN